MNICSPILSLLFLLSISLTIPGTKAVTYKQNTAIYLDVGTLRAVANVLTATLPGELFIGKDIMINFTLDLGWFLQLNIERIHGISVNLADEDTSFDVNKDKNNTLTLGVNKFTVELELYYSFSLLGQFIHLGGAQQPIIIDFNELDLLLDATITPATTGMLMGLSFSNTYVNFKEFELTTGYALFDYLLSSIHFLWKKGLTGGIGLGLNAASGAINKILQSTDPDLGIFAIFPTAGIRVGVIETPAISQESLRIEVMADVNFIDLVTKQPFDNNYPDSVPNFDPNLDRESNIWLADNAINSGIAALMLQKYTWVSFMVTSKSLQIFPIEIPALQSIYGADGEYQMTISPEDNISIVGKTGGIYLTGDFLCYLEGRESEWDDWSFAFSYISTINSTLNVTMWNYQVFLMIMDLTTSKSVLEDHSPQVEGLDLVDWTKLVGKFLIKMMGYFNGSWMVPVNLREKINYVDYASKYFQKMVARFDFSNDFYILGFDGPDLQNIVKE